MSTDIIDIIIQKPNFVRKDVMTTKTFDKSIKDLDPEIKPVARSLLTYLNERFYALDVEVPRNYRFTLPANCIDEKDGQKELLSLRLPQQKVMDSFESLSNEQLRSLWKDGTFRVKTENPDLDDVWKAAIWLAMGYDNIDLKFRKNFAKFLRLLIYAVDLFRPSRISWTFKYTLRPNLWSGLLQLLMIVLNLFELVMGLPCYTLSENVHTEAKKRIEADRNTLMLSQSYPTTKALAELIREIPDYRINMGGFGDEKEVQAAEAHLKRVVAFKHVLVNLDREFSEYQTQRKASRLADLGDVYPEQYEEVSKEIDARRFEDFIEFLNDPALKTGDLDRAMLINKLKCLAVIENRTNEYNRDLEFTRQEITANIGREYQWRSKIEWWLRRETASRFAIYKQKRREQLYTDILTDLEKQHLEEDRSLFSSSVKYKKERKTAIEALKSELKKSLRQPAYVKALKRRLWKPYNLVQTSCNGIYNYHLEKHSYVTVDSRFVFWRVQAFIIRLIVRVSNFLYVVTSYMASGQFGFRALFGCSVYYRDYSVNPQTGEVKNDHDRVVPVIPRFRKVMNGIRKSRQKFESEPNAGILGKNMARVFNLFENYIIRFLLVGVILVLMLHPLLNTLVIMGCIFLIMTSVIWVLLFILLTIFIKLFIYDYTALRYHQRDENQLGSRLDKILSPSLFFPIPQAFFKLFWGGFVQICYCLIVPPINLALCVLLLIGASLLFILRLIYNFLVHNLIIRCFGKVPTNDTNMARRIAGPGISKNLFYTLSVEDAAMMCLIRLEIEKLSMFSDQMTAYLKQPIVSLSEKMDAFMRALTGTTHSVNILKAEQTRVDELIERLNTQVSQKITDLRKHIDKIPATMIRFNSTDLIQIKTLVESLIKGFIASNNLEDCIWDYFKLAKGQYKQLVQEVIVRSFQNCKEVLSPLSEVDKLIVMVKVGNSSDQKVLLEQILEGEVSLDQMVPILKEKPKASASIVQTKCADLIDVYGYKNYRIKGFREIALVDDTKKF